MVTRNTADNTAGKPAVFTTALIGKAFGLAVTIVLVVVAVAVFAVPRVLGGASLTVLTGSMRPTFSPGDVVVVRGVAQADVCQTIKIGQIVTYLPQPNDPSLITHRVIGKTAGKYDDGTSCRLITQGDANSAADNPVSPVQVRGVFLYGLPKLGWVRQWVSQHLIIFLVACAAAALAYLLWPSRSTKKQTEPEVAEVVAVSDVAAAPATAATVAPATLAMPTTLATPATLATLAEPEDEYVASPYWHYAAPSRTRVLPTPPRSPDWGTITAPGWMATAVAPPALVARRAVPEAFEFELRLREIELRERELALREAEMSLMAARY